jgi:uncharacterized membrane protein YphA (DoxX/SURF4 family)
MKIAILIVRILLGLAFFGGGLNHIINAHPVPMPGDAGVYINMLIATKYMTIVGLLELIGGLLLLVGRFVPLGLTILGPIIVNILLFGLLIAHQGVILGIVCVVLEAFLIWAYRLSFRGLFDASPEVS